MKIEELEKKVNTLYDPNTSRNISTYVDNLQAAMEYLDNLLVNPWDDLQKK